MLGGRQAECPNCGAPIAWQLGSSQGAVCSYCRFSVIRKDRALSALGRVADLVPTAAPIAVGDRGSAGGRSFRVLGRTQLDHGRGPWDEWYLGFDDGGWGWLARAQGRWYLTFEREPGEAPRWDELPPGSRVQLSGTGSVAWIVSERGGSALLSAEGELPFPVHPQASGRYCDLEAEGGAFATLDFGDGSEPVRLYAGRELADGELVIGQRALGPRPTERVEVAKLSCPSCGAPIELFVPSECERVGCTHCGALLDHTRGTLSLLQQLEPPAVQPLIPLGARGQLLGAERTVIGFMQRKLTVEGELYTFREYLLHADGGYSWLVEEDHHWLHVAPVPTSAVKEVAGGALHEGVRYRAFARGTPEVDFVVGEFYWQVRAGDRASTCDYIAPPRALSSERTENELSWSAGSYVEPAAVAEAFSLRALPRPSGVAPAQPNPYRGRGPTLVLALLAVLWFLLAFAYEIGRGKQVREYDGLSLPPRASAAAPAASATLLTEPFEITRGPTVIEVQLETTVRSGWVQVEASLVPEDGSEPRALTLSSERYESARTSGDDASSAYFPRVGEGRYTMRFVGSWSPDDRGIAYQADPPQVRLIVTEGSRSPFCCAGTLVLIALPWLLGRLRGQVFEVRRRANENLG